MKIEITYSVGYPSNGVFSGGAIELNCISDTEDWMTKEDWNKLNEVQKNNYITTRMYEDAEQKLEPILEKVKFIEDNV